MTCIVAVTDGKNVVLGADSAVVSGKELRLRADPRVFTVDPYAFGFSTSLRLGQILRYTEDLPEPPADADRETLYRFLCTEFLDAVRERARDGGFGEEYEANEENPGLAEEGREADSQFLVGVGGQIFEVLLDFGVKVPQDPYAAIGEGAGLALGAFYALRERPDLSLRDRAERALSASEAFCSAVRPPFHFAETEATRV